MRAILTVLTAAMLGCLAAQTYGVLTIVVADWWVPWWTIPLVALVSAIIAGVLIVRAGWFR